MAGIIKKEFYSREEAETFCTQYQKTMNRPALREDQVSTLFKRIGIFRLRELERSEKNLKERIKTCSYCTLPNFLCLEKGRIVWYLKPCCALADYCSSACKLKDRKYHRNEYENLPLRDC
jgi:hypothetical protein